MLYVFFLKVGISRCIILKRNYFSDDTDIEVNKLMLDVRTPLTVRGENYMIVSRRKNPRNFLYRILDIRIIEVLKFPI